MSIVDHTQAIHVPFSVADTFEALQKAIKATDGFTLDRVDETLKAVYLKAGVSLFSWGENITATVKKCSEGGSEVSVLSTPKTGAMFGGAMDMGKNRKNIAAISDALSKELKQYKPEAPQHTSFATNSVADEIKKLAELKDQGILSEQEFAEKKKQLLNL